MLFLLETSMFNQSNSKNEASNQGSKLTFLLRSQLATKRKNLVTRSKCLVPKLFNKQLSRKHDFKCYFTYKESHNKTGKKEQHEKDVLSGYGCSWLLCFWFRDGVLFDNFHFLLLELHLDDHHVQGSSITGIKLVPRMSFGNLVKSTFSTLTTDEGFKFSVNLLAESSSSASKNSRKSCN